MICGCFSYYSMGDLMVLPINERMIQCNYILFCDFFPTSFETCTAETFMKDGAPYQKVKPVLEWLKDCQVAFTEDQPDNSPDLNLTENLQSLTEMSTEEGHVKCYEAGDGN